MSDLISRRALLKSIGEVSTSPLNEWDTIGVLNIVNKQPTVEAKEVVHGKWEDDQYVWKCNRCNRWLEVTDGNGEMNFCPNCGADMRKKV